MQKRVAHSGKSTHSGRAMKILLGKRLRELRVASGLTQEQLAARVNIRNTYVSAIENGTREPRLRLFARICAELGVTMDEVYREAAA